MMKATIDRSNAISPNRNTRTLSARFAWFDRSSVARRTVALEDAGPRLRPRTLKHDATEAAKGPRVIAARPRFAVNRRHTIGLAEFERVVLRVIHML
jgi:hypothetical protein